jgi:chromosome segregation ATPase
MQRTNFLVVIAGCIGLLFVAPVVSSQTRLVEAPDDGGHSLRAAVAQLTSELKALKLDVLRLQIEAVQARLDQAENGWRVTQQEQQRLEEEDRELGQEVQELDAQLLQPTLSPEMRADIVQAKFNAQTSGVAALRAERAAADTRESTARARFEQARKAHSELLARAVKLGLVGPNELGH